jgi:very-long-chain enoyl-CoA reductase
MASGYQFYPTRQKLSLVGDRKPLEDDTLLKDAGLTEAAPELAAKDLGPQISWKTVFLVEYVRAPVRFAFGVGSLTTRQFGPLWIHPLFYYLPQLFYGRAMQHSTLQQYVFGLDGALSVLSVRAADTYSLPSCFTTPSASSKHSCEQR